MSFGTIRCNGGFGGHALGAGGSFGARSTGASSCFWSSGCARQARGVAEGQWLKQLGMSPYAGSMYHGSPLLLATLGPLLHMNVLISLGADILTAYMLQAISRRQTLAHVDHMAALRMYSSSSAKEKKQLIGHNGIGDVAGLLYLVNPLTIVTCVGGTTSPFETLVTVLALYGAVLGNVPLAAFGWALSTHLSMYPGILLAPIALLLVFGLDRPQKKLFAMAELYEEQQEQGRYKTSPYLHKISGPYWAALRDLAIWAVVWWLCILGLCSLALGPKASLAEMFTRTYGFTLSVVDLTPNLGLFWYFFTEIFDHFRSFFTLVFHSNIAFLILPITLRMPHRPLFVAFILLTICSFLRSYPSIGDAALSCGLLPLFAMELADMRFTCLLFFGNLLVMTLGPVMYNLWIWRGTGNANFYFAINLVYAALQTILIVESLGTVIKHDRELKKAVEDRVSIPREKRD